MNPSIIRELILAGLDDAEVNVAGDDGVHFEALVISSQFEGLRPLQRHRIVYATLGEKLGGEIHALALKTLTPAEAAERGVG